MIDINLVLVGLGLGISLGLAGALWGVWLFDWWQDHRKHREARG